MTKNIPSIYNYCDRWCERCAFSNRCEVGIQEMKSKVQHDMNTEAFWEEIGKNFDKAIEMLHKAAKERGIEISELNPEEEKAHRAKEKKKQKEIDDTALIALSLQYTDLAHEWLKENKELDDKGLELISHLELGVKTGEQTEEITLQIKESLEIIQWYLFFFYIKFQRAMSGKIEEHEWDKEHGFQTDTNGSAKVALIAVERTMGAWLKMLELGAFDEDKCLDLLALLEQIKNAAIKEFPDAFKFVRAGFDE
jgi:hypothetical protein